MRRCDVLIVGGGPAGSSCAWALARSGLDVLIIDRAEFPRHKLCAGWITPQVVSALLISLEHYGGGRILQPITGFRTGTIDGPHVETNYRAVVSYAIRRCEFDTYLLHRSGACLELGWTVNSLRREAGCWVVSASALDSAGDRRPAPDGPAREIGAPMLVGAGGHFCPVARAISPPRSHPEPIVAAQEIEFRMSPAQQAACVVSGSMPEISLCRDLAGYGWLVRKGDFLNVGFGRLGAAHLRVQVEAFLEFLERAGRLPPDTPRRWAGHPYLLYDTTPRRMVDDGVLLVGDSAGLACGQSGEGIRPAIESGLLAAETIIEARGQYAVSHLDGYRRRLAARFGVPAPRRAPARLLPAPVRETITSHLLGTRWFARRFLLDRWFLHRDLAPLAPPPVHARSSAVA